MFYLIKFFNILKKNPLKGGSFIFLTLVVILFSGLKGDLDKNIFSKLGPHKQGSYFFSLISEKENYNSAVRKIKSLPGVEFVRILNKNIVEKEVSELLRGLDVLEGLDQKMNMRPIKIGLTFGISNKSKNLILKYLIRLVGEKNIYVGNIIPEKITENVKLTFFSIWGSLIVWVALGLLWFFAAFSLCGEIKKYSYIINSFQRKKFVGPKLSMAGLSFIFFLSILFLIIFSQNIQYLSMTLTFIISLVFMILNSIKQAWN